MKGLRIDKWLWSVRIFKTRTLAANACKNGHVKIGEKKAKPATSISELDFIEVHKNGFNLSFQVIKLIQKRVSYTLASECYEDLTSEEELNKFKSWYIGKGKAEMREQGQGRPTKKERRELDQFKDLEIYDFDE